MTKRDYVAITAVMAKHRPDPLERARGLWNDILDDLIDIMKANPRFDERRFRIACDEGEGGGK